MLPTALDAERGFVLEGDLTLPAAGQPARGLYIECAPGSGAAILIDADGKAELGSINADGTGWEMTFAEDRECAFGAPAKLRLMLQRDLLEFYLDDVLIECFSLPSAATGRLGLITGGDASAIGNFAGWRV